MTIRPLGILFRRTFWAFAIVACASLTFATAQARAETRTLKIYYLHTGERAEITFKRNGRYDQKGLDRLNVFLRDWRHNEPTKMDPRLFDLVWEVYQKVGATDYINVVSAYRSPATNSMLRKNTSGVAKNSQHMQGRAMDFFIPGVPLKKLRETAMKMQRGGVGYYPTSGSPFVHLDVASVRAWPRMSRSQLVALFPEGHTLHLPADGKPLPGYAEALAEYKAKGSVGGSSAAPVRVASNNNTADDGDEDERPNLMAMLFRRGSDDGNDRNSSSSRNTASTPSNRSSAPAATRASEPPAQRPVDILTAAVSFDDVDIPIPMTRPGGLDEGLGTPLATALVDPQTPVSPAEVAIAANIPLPVARPSGLDQQTGLSVVDAIAENSVEEPGNDLIAMAVTDGSDDMAGLLGTAVPIPSPRVAFAETGATLPDDFDQARLSAAVPLPLHDPRGQARVDLARKLQAMGDTTVVAVNEEDDFRTVFRPSLSRALLQTSGTPSKGGRPDAIEQVVMTEASVQQPATVASSKMDVTSQRHSNGSSLATANVNEGDTTTIVEYFDTSRF